MKCSPRGFNELHHLGNSACNCGRGLAGRFGRFGGVQEKGRNALRLSMDRNSSVMSGAGWDKDSAWCMGETWQIKREDPAIYRQLRGAAAEKLPALAARLTDTSRLSCARLRPHVGHHT